MRIVGAALSMVLVLSAASFAAGPAMFHGERNYAPVPVGPTASPADITGVLFARSFTLDQPYTFTWRRDEPEVHGGWLLVVGVTPSLAVQKDSWNPVLYVGRYPAEIAATDPDAGRFVVIVPGDVDLARDPVYFGSVELPCEVTAARGAEEMQAALEAGFRPMTPEALRLAEAAGGGAIQAPDAHALYAGAVADAIDAYAPAARGVAEALRMPVLGTH